jgi:hypothetical protein
MRPIERAKTLAACIGCSWEGKNTLMWSKFVHGCFGDLHARKSKVLGTTTGHYTYLFYDPLDRLILIREIAWAIDGNLASFMPLVLHGIFKN